jgi:hypothetical protein
MRSDEVPQHTEVQTFRKEGSAEIVDMAGIGTRIFTLPREISGCRVHQREVSRSHSSWWQRADTARIRSEDSPANEGLNIGFRPNSMGSTVLVQPHFKRTGLTV